MFCLGLEKICLFPVTFPKITNVGKVGKLIYLLKFFFLDIYNNILPIFGENFLFSSTFSIKWPKLRKRRDKTPKMFVVGRKIPGWSDYGKQTFFSIGLTWSPQIYNL